MSRNKKKKKFGETKVGAFLKDKAPKILEFVGDSLPDKGILGVVSNLISKDDKIAPADKETALELLKMDLAEMEAVTTRHANDMTSDSWLSKNVRPLVLLWLILFVTVLIVSDSIEAWTFEVKDVWITLLTTLLVTVITFYFGSRGMEKWQKIKKG